MTVSQGKTIGGDGLVYDLDYEYDENFVHRLKRAGDRYYKYDESGRLVEEKEGETEEQTDTTRLTRTVKKETENVYSQDYGWGLSNEATKEAQNAAKDNGNGSDGGSSSGFKRTYTWDEKGRLIATSDQNADVEYLYGEDNQRAVKSSDTGETLYFNNFWTWSNNSTVYNGERTAKHIFLNSERIVTKLNSANNPTYSEESASTYYYHSDHLGSASVISDNDGREYERIEYTPYGEVWIDKASATYKTAYRFTGKERDEETGLYYFGERYLDAKVSRWLSCDPALSDFVAGQSNGVSGGMFNSVNMNLYHYAGNSPVVAKDPDGRDWLCRKYDGVSEVFYRDDITSTEQAQKAYGNDAYVLEHGQSFNGYTFYNGENPYMTNSSGDRVNQSLPIQGSDYDIFPGSASKQGVNPDKLHNNFFGTSYTGPKNPTDYGTVDSDPKPNFDYWPRNQSEYFSIEHDHAYDDAGVAGVRGALFSTKVIGADYKLAFQNLGNVFTSQSVGAKDRLRSLGTFYAFSFLATFKLKNAATLHLFGF
jgi:RHS repeat-associated protein